jgi:hypothetical protein
VAVNHAIFEGVTAEQVEQLARRAMRGEELHAEHPEAARVSCASDPYDGGEKYGAVRQLVSTRDYDGVLATLKEAELRGMGGAGFPTAMKWDLVRKQAEPEKYVVCNADESEPGTIKDRFILSKLPHLVVEGMMIAGFVTGAKKGILYIRHEYPLQEEILGEELRWCMAGDWTGRPGGVLFPNHANEVKKSNDGYLEKMNSQPTFLWRQETAHFLRVPASFPRSKSG